MQPRELSRATASIALLLLVAITVVIRLWGIDFMLPHFTHLDGTIVIAQVDLIRSHAPNAGDHPMWGYYPHLLSELVALLPDPNRVPLPEGASLAQHLARATQPILQIRLVAALASVLLVPGTYKLARLFLSRGWSLCAAAWIATSVLTTSFAQQDRPHGLAAPLALFAVLAAVRLRRSALVRDYVLAGIAAALAVCALQYNVFVLPALLVAYWLRVRGPERASSWWLLAIVVPLVIGVRYFYPFYFGGHFKAGDEALALSGEDGDVNLNISGQWVYLAHFNGGGFPVLISALCSYDPVILATGLFGACTWFVRVVLRRKSDDVERRRDLWVVLAYAIPFFTAIGVYRFSGERFLLPLEPYIAVLGAWGLERTLGAWMRSRPDGLRRWAVPVCIVIVLQIPPALFAFAMDKVRAAPDTFEQAAAWLSEHARPEEDLIVALPYLELPLFHTSEVLQREDKFSYWLQYEAKQSPATIGGPRFNLELPSNKDATYDAWGDAPLAHLREIGADYVVIQDVGPRYRYVLVPKTLKALRKQGEMVARFSPLAVDDGGNVNNSIRYTQPPLSNPFVLRMIQSRCMGPTIELYRVPSAGRAADK